jgi:myosin heavy subunit
MMIESDNLLVKSLVRLMPQGKSKKHTVTFEFKSQLISLMVRVKASSPHFVRCLKPNHENQANIFNQAFAAEQLRYGGVLQAVQVGRSGYAVRIPHEDFWQTYRLLLPEREKDLEALEGKPAKERAHAMLQMFDEKYSFNTGMFDAKFCSWAVGHTLVFLKQVVHDTLNAPVEDISLPN